MKKSTYSNGPPVTKLTDSVGQNESGKPENSEELMEGWREEGGMRETSKRSDTV